MTFRRSSRWYHSGCSDGGSLNDASEFLSGELPREVVHERARLRPGVHVGGAGQHREDLAVEDVPQHAVDFLHLHAALGELRIAEPGERVARLPVVVVGVEDRRDLVGGVRHPLPRIHTRGRSRRPGLHAETLLAVRASKPLFLVRFRIMPGEAQRPARAQTQAERRQKSEQALLDAAAALIAERGVEQTSLARIGESAGTSRGLPTHHFGSKDAPRGAARPPVAGPRAGGDAERARAGGPARREPLRARADPHHALAPIWSCSSTRPPRSARSS